MKSQNYFKESSKIWAFLFQIQAINGVILISWRQKVLERQIDYGAKLGQVVLSLARMELNNFYKNVMPVADYFDQSNMLIAVSIVLCNKASFRRAYKISHVPCVTIK